MAIVRWNSIREMEELTGRLNKLFGLDLAPRGGEEPLTGVDWIPSVDIVETEKEYLVKAELPEVKKEDVNLTVENGVLTVQGERKQEKEENGKKFHRVERSYGFFERSFSLPDNADETNISAEFKEGVLNIHLAKSEKAKPKKIEARAS